MDCTSQLAKNAIESIRLGFEDYEMASKDKGRIISSIRNMYAGILLLLKEELRCLSPKGSYDVLIQSEIELFYDSQLQQLICKGKNKSNGNIGKTIDFNEMKYRFKIMGRPLSSTLINLITEIKKERNNIEHYYSNETINTLQGLVAKSTLVINELFKNYLHEDPIMVLGNTWKEMLEVKTLHDELRKDYLTGLKKALHSSKDSRWFQLIRDYYACPECGIDIFEIEKGSSDIQFTCKGCNTKQNIEDVKKAFPESYCKELEYRMNREYGLDSDDIELGVSERVLACPKCGKKTYLYLPDQDVSKCENCNFEYSYINCSMCSTTLESYELDDAENNRGLCSYCLYKMHKIEEED